MARPPFGQLPETEPTSDEVGIDVAPNGGSSADGHQGRSFFGLRATSHSSPRLNPARLSEDTIAASGDVSPRLSGIPSSLASIAETDIGRDPFSYLAAPRSRLSDPFATAQSDIRDISMSPSLDARDGTRDMPEETQPSALNADVNSLPRWTGERKSVGFQIEEERARRAALRREMRYNQMASGASAGEPLPEPHSDTIASLHEPETSSSAVQPDAMEGLTRAIPNDDDAGSVLSDQRHHSDESVTHESVTHESVTRNWDHADRFDDVSISSDIRVTRAVPQAFDGHESHVAPRRPRLSNGDAFDRTEPRFDSASDEAVTDFDPSVPPLYASDRARQRDARLHSTMQNVRPTPERDQNAAMTALASRLQMRASYDGEQIAAPRGEAVLGQARKAISYFRAKVDDARVARAEARFKPTVPTPEDLIAQYQTDQMDEELALLNEPLVVPPEDRRMARILPLSLPKSFWSWQRRSHAPISTSVQRHRRQSRLYEDIIAWIVVPPFIIGAIYGILELSKYLSNSPIGKMLSGQ